MTVDGNEPQASATLRISSLVEPQVAVLLNDTTERE